MAVVLVVEDEAQVLALTQSYLEEQGHRVLSATTAEGAEALLAQEKGDIDILITDIVLHGDIHAGIELAKQAVARQPELRVLYTTGQPITDGTKALLVDDSAVLEKPYTVDQLLTSLVVHFRAPPSPRAPGFSQ
jgi:two-component system, cell cycle response regulator CpdR